MTANDKTTASASKAEALRSVRSDLLAVRTTLAKEADRKCGASRENLLEAIRHLDLAISEIDSRTQSAN